MCGIIGFISLSAKDVITPLHIKRIERVLEIMKFRGPDGSGIMNEKQWIFGHTRLAIIDPDSGQQPIKDAHTGITITYNGEIYNHKDLRADLEKLGHKFETNCDTEVVLRSYIEWGEDCVERFNGFFAFAIANPHTNKVFIARDRLGIKPLFYSLTNSSLCFGSTIPGILTCTDIEMTPNVEAMSHYLTTSKTTFGEETLLKGINCLIPGYCMSIDLTSGDTQIRKYWEIPIVKKDDKEEAPFTEVVAKTRDLFDSSIKQRLMSDVPLGSFLSGGLDSAIIATTADKYTGFKLPLFCAGSDYEASNEFKYARMVAEQLDSDLTEIKMTHEKFMDSWSFLIQNKGLPLSTPNEVSIYHLAAALQKQCKVTLTGEGADEIFGGYIQPHYSAIDFDRLPNDEDDPQSESLFGCIMMLECGRNFFINETDHYTSTSSWMSYMAKEKLFNPDTWDAIDEDDAVFGFYEDFFESLEGCSTFDKYMHLHARYNLESLLGRVDNCTMSASIEARVPFTDHRIVEHAFTQPDHYKMDFKTQEFARKAQTMTAAQIDQADYLESKRLVRQAFGNKLPYEIVNRKKMSFPVPFQEWFFGPLLEEITLMCINSELIKKYFEFETVKAMILGMDKNLWLIANLCRWWDEMVEINSQR